VSGFGVCPGAEPAARVATRRINADATLWGAWHLTPHNAFERRDKVADRRLGLDVAADPGLGTAHDLIVRKGQRDDGGLGRSIEDAARVLKPAGRRGVEQHDFGEEVADLRQRLRARRSAPEDPDTAVVHQDPREAVPVEPHCADDEGTDHERRGRSRNATSGIDPSPPDGSGT
jgi:hypothetical protein